MNEHYYEMIGFHPTEWEGDGDLNSRPEDYLLSVLNDQPGMEFVWAFPIPDGSFKILIRQPWSQIVENAG